MLANNIGDRRQAGRSDQPTAPPGEDAPVFVFPADNGHKPRSPSKRAAALAAEIERDIVRRGWPVGMVLGSETDLIATYKVSRAVFREAMRLLEHHHIAEMRRGRKGGLTVIEPDPASLTDATALYLQYHGVDPDNLLEARQSVELTCARLAAERATEEDIVKLRTLANRVSSSPAELAENSAEFHETVAATTRNPALHLFVQVLYLLTQNSIDHSLVMPLANVVNHAHAAIAEAIAAGDVALAQHRMLRHFEAMTTVEGLTSSAARESSAAVR
jgi:DNA-binding FadR family transcriptional regulator